LARAEVRAAEDVLARSAFATALAQARKRLVQRVRAVQHDIDRIDEAEAWAARAPWLVAAAARALRGAQSLEVSDWSTGEERKLSFPLDPSRTAREQVEAAFQRARRLRRGRPLAERRQEEAKKAIEAIDQFTSELAEDPLPLGERAAAGARYEELRERVIAALPHDVRGGILRAHTQVESRLRQSRRPPVALSGSRGKPEKEAAASKTGAVKKAPFRTFTARSGMRILVGRRAELNDQLTFQVSRPHHLWLHAKDQPGAHVIAWNEKEKSLTEGELVDAAMLAAHFSEARGEPVVDVTYTQRRYVRKPRRAPAGLVLADRAKVIAVRIEPAHLQALLESELV